MHRLMFSKMRLDLAGLTVMLMTGCLSGDDGEFGVEFDALSMSSTGFKTDADTNEAESTGVPACESSCDGDQGRLQITIDDSQLDAEHGWEEIAAGVFRKTDPANNTVSMVSVGEAGRLYDLGLATANLADARQRLANAIPRGEDTIVLRGEIAEFEQAVDRLTMSPVATNGSSHDDDESAGCHNVRGTFRADFLTGPRAGGGTVGTVTATTRAVSCLGFECTPFEDAYATGYSGGTKAWVKAINSGGINSGTQYSNNGYSVDMYTYPQSAVTRSTFNVADAACTLTAGGWINTTAAVTPYQNCYLYKNFYFTKTCAQVP